jgi:hypothetical protein
MQRDWQCEYEDGEGRSSGKKDGGAAHQGVGSGADEVADGVARRCFSKGGSAVKAEGLAGIDLQVREEKGTNVVLIKVKVAPVTGSFEDAPVTDSGKRQRGEVNGAAACFTGRGKHGEGERKERGHGSDILHGGGAERELGAARSGATQREEERGGAGGAWREGGPVAAARERRSRVTAGWCCSVEQGSRGRRHVGPQPQYQAARLKFDSISNFKWIQIIFKSFQILTDPKMTFPSSKILK